MAKSGAALEDGAFRTLKRMPEGEIPREEIRRALRSVHVVPGAQGGWDVRKAGRRRVSKRFSTQEEALRFAGSLAADRDTAVVVHQKSGKVVTLDPEMGRSIGSKRDQR